MKGEPMSDEVMRYSCANCGALYDLVRVEAESVGTDCELACLMCSAPLQSRDGRFALKYFLLEPPRPRHAQRIAARRAM